MPRRKRTGIMLAKKATLAKLQALDTNGFYVQPKLDGFRCRVVLDDEAVLYSSTGKVITSVPSILNVYKLLRTFLKIELDGELYAHGLSFQKISSIVSRTNQLHPNHLSISHVLYDICNTQLRMSSRVDVLSALKTKLYKLNLTYNIEILETHYCSKYTEIQYWLDRFIDEGYEGIIIRPMNGLYVQKRTWDLIKMKPRHIMIAKVVGYQQLMSEVCSNCRNTPSKCECLHKDWHKKPVEMLGAFICSILNDDPSRTLRIEFSVGSGHLLTHINRSKLWIERDKLPGKYIKIKYQELSDTGVPRFPVVEAFSE